MPSGTLEVLLVSAQGLQNTDFLCNSLNPLIAMVEIADVLNLDLCTSPKEFSPMPLLLSILYWGSDLAGNMDPYVVIRCRTQEQKSSVASSQGSNPEWNEKFIFSVSEGATDLTLKIMDKDNLSEDDCVGEACIPLEGVFLEGSLPPAPYNVVLPDKTYCGEIKVGLVFIPKTEEEEEEAAACCDEGIGGWKQGSI